MALCGRTRFEVLFELISPRLSRIASQIPPIPPTPSQKSHLPCPTHPVAGLLFGMLRNPRENGLDAVEWARLVQRFEAGERPVDLAREIGQSADHVRRKLRELARRPEAEKAALIDQSRERELVKMEALLNGGNDAAATKRARALTAICNARRAFEMARVAQSKLAEAHRNDASDEADEDTLSDDEFEALKRRIERRAILLHERRLAAGLSEDGEPAAD